MDVTLDLFPFGGGVTLTDSLVGCQEKYAASDDLKSGRIVSVVTSGRLQTVHHIGQGLARFINNTSVIASIDHPSIDISEDEVLSLIRQYAGEAKRLATKSFFHFHGNSSRISKLTHEKIKQVIYGDDDSSVVNEWYTLLKKL